MGKIKDFSFSKFLLDGYCIINEIISEDEIKELSNEVDKLISSKKPENTTKTAWFWDEDHNLSKKLQKMLNNILRHFDSYFLIKPLLLRSWVRNSYPGYSGSSWHQDVNLNHIPLPLIISIPLTDLNSDNGSLFIIPRSQHLLHPIHNREKINQEIEIEIKKGDITVFLSSVWHRGGENNTMNDRRIAFFEYTDKSFSKIDINIKKYQESQYKII